MEKDPQVKYIELDYTDAQFRHRIVNRVKSLRKHNRMTYVKEMNQLSFARELVSEVHDYVQYLEKCTPKALWLQAYTGQREFPEGLFLFLKAYRLTPSFICCLEETISKNPITSIIDIITTLREENFDDFLRRCAEN